MALLLFALRGPIAYLFHAAGVTRAIIYPFCGRLSLLFFFNGAIFVANVASDNLRRPLHSTWTNWGRHTLGTMPFALLGGQWFGVTGVLIGQATGGVLFGILASVLAERMLGGLVTVPNPAVPGGIA